jgi:ATP-dependent RNA helicase DeaD
VQLAHAAVAGDGDDRVIPAVTTAHHDPRATRPLKSARGRLVPPEESNAGNMARLFVGAGRRAGIRPGDLVGAITGEAGIQSRAIGAIEIADGFSLVDVPEEMVDDIITALRATKIRGLKPTVKRDRS